MKTPSRGNINQGFTLVELLVVIAIIAVLAGAGFGAGRAAMEKARKVSGQAAATAVVTAVDQFYTEYSALPDPTGSSTTDSNIDSTSASGVALLEVLMGKEDGTTVQNDRKINFLSLPTAKGSSAANSRGGVYYTSGDPASLRDPWGEAYTIVMDLDYDDQIVAQPGNGISSTTLNNVRSAVFSLGVKDSDDADSSTLVKTW